MQRNINISKNIQCDANRYQRQTLYSKLGIISQKTLNNLSFFNVWIKQRVGDVNIFLSVIKQRLSDTFVQNWHERLNESSRASFN